MCHFDLSPCNLIFTFLKMIDLKIHSAEHWGDNMRCIFWAVAWTLAPTPVYKILLSFCVQSQRQNGSAEFGLIVEVDLFRIAFPFSDVAGCPWLLLTPQSIVLVHDITHHPASLLVAVHMAVLDTCLFFSRQRLPDLRLHFQWRQHPFI